MKTFWQEINRNIFWEKVLNKIEKREHFILQNGFKIDAKTNKKIIRIYLFGKSFRAFKNSPKHIKKVKMLIEEYELIISMKN